MAINNKNDDTDGTSLDDELDFGTNETRERKNSHVHFAQRVKVIGQR